MLVSYLFAALSTQEQSIGILKQKSICQPETHFKKGNNYKSALAVSRII